MLSFADVAARPEFRITTVTCQDDHKGWSEVESPDEFRLVLVRRGRFRRRANGVLTELDPTVAYVGVPGEEEHFAHPAGGDVCTLVSLTPTLWSALAGDSARLAGAAVYVDPRLDLTHRRLLTAAHAGDVDFGLTEQVLGLLGGVVERVVAGPTPVRGSAAGDDAALVADARRLIGADHPTAGGLIPLAAELDVSPYRLSRAFTRELGVSLTRYRTRVRLGRALDRLSDGETSLAGLAADLGFADQAHLCRAMSEHLGQTPSAVRRILSSPAWH